MSQAPTKAAATTLNGPLWDTPERGGGVRVCPADNHGPFELMKKRDPGICKGRRNTRGHKKVTDQRPGEAIEEFLNVRDYAQGGGVSDKATFNFALQTIPNIGRPPFGEASTNMGWKRVRKCQKASTG